MKKVDFDIIKILIRFNTHSKKGVFKKGNLHTRSTWSDGVNTPW